MEISDNKFDDNIKQILELLYELRKLLQAKNRLNGETILDNQDIYMLFKLTSRSLQRYRSSGELPYMRIGGKPFYLESEVRKFLRSRKRNKPPGEDENDAVYGE
ncbi:MAG: helix-turn-helix domain-containing protein [Prevotella sp.]|jgi:ornithine carbamoyltransferase|nr:helix-turn-helix domain-containing protein [Prevotella sp.]